MKYRIQVVSEKLQVPKSTIRYWEKEFSDFIQPERTRGGQRRYCEQDIENLHQLKSLLYHRKRTIDETKDIWVVLEVTHLAGEYPAGMDPGPAVDGKVTGYILIQVLGKKFKT